VAHLSRAPSAPPGRRFDLVVVGGGISGVCVALESIRRGLTTLLLEADDFGGHTSWSSLRILHGGLRYLQRADLARFRESVHDRRWFQRAFPTLTVPQPVLMPLRGAGLRRPAVMRAALRVNDLLAAHRNAGLAVAARLPGGSLLDREATLAALPPAWDAGVRGGALWWDARADPPQRILMELLLRAVAEGAEAWSRAPVSGIGRTGGRGEGDLEVHIARARVEPPGSVAPESVLAGRVAVCVGPEAPAIAGVVAGLPQGAPAAGAAFNLVLRRPLPTRYGIAVDPPDGGVTLFAYPHGDLTLAGTVHGPGAPGIVEPPTQAEVAAFVARLRAALGGWEVEMADVARVLWGALPCLREGTDVQSPRPWLLPVPGLGDAAWVGVGVKYTTAPSLARALVDRLAPGSKAAPALDARPVRAVPDARTFLDLAARDRAAASELVRSLASEGADTIEDVVMRRSDWGLDPTQGEEVAAAVDPLGPFSS
jgi:glycerol-3-phosphate dehydrogenase